MYYVLDGKGNKVESYDKQGFLSALQQAITNGDLTGIDADSAFVSKMKCCVGGGTFKMAFVTQAKYNELKVAAQLLPNALYFITDDNTEANLEAALAALQADFDGLTGDGGTLEKIMNGTVKVGDSKKLNGVEIIQDANGVLKQTSSNPMAWYEIVEELSSAEGTTYISIATDTPHKAGDVITYQGDTATITSTNYADEPNMYRARTATGNAFCKAIGTTITVGDPDIVIPQKRLLWQGGYDVQPTGSVAFDIGAGNLAYKRLQIEVEVWPTGSASYLRKYSSNTIMFGQTNEVAPVQTIKFLEDGKSDVLVACLDGSSFSRIKFARRGTGVDSNQLAKIVGVYEIIE